LLYTRFCAPDEEIDNKYGLLCAETFRNCKMSRDTLPFKCSVSNVSSQFMQLTTVTLGPFWTARGFSFAASNVCLAHSPFIYDMHYLPAMNALFEECRLLGCDAGRLS
jgi:hypothetical protein